MGRVMNGASGAMRGADCALLNYRICIRQTIQASASASDLKSSTIKSG